MGGGVARVRVSVSPFLTPVRRHGILTLRRSRNGADASRDSSFLRMRARCPRTVLANAGLFVNSLCVCLTLIRKGAEGCITSLPMTSVKTGAFAPSVAVTSLVWGHSGASPSAFDLQQSIENVVLGLFVSVCVHFAFIVRMSL